MRFMTACFSVTECMAVNSSRMGRNVLVVGKTTGDAFGVSTFNTNRSTTQANTFNTRANAGMSGRNCHLEAWKEA